MFAAGDTLDMKKKQSCRRSEDMELLQTVGGSRRLKEALQAERRCLLDRVNDLEERKSFLSYNNKHDDLWLLQAQKENEDMSDKLQTQREKKKMLEEENRTFTDQNHNTETILREVQAENRKLLSDLQAQRERERDLNQENLDLTDQISHLQTPPAQSSPPPHPELCEEEPDQSNRKLQLQLQETQKLIVHSGEIISLQHREITSNQQVIEEYRQCAKHLRKTVRDLREQLEIKLKEGDHSPTCTQHDNTKSLFDELQEEEEEEEEDEEEEEEPPRVHKSEHQHLDHGWFLKKSPDVTRSPGAEPWWRYYGNWFLTMNRYVGRAALRFFYVSSA